MKTLFLTLPFLILMSSLPVFAATALEDWTLEDVLAKIEEANGGMDAIETATNARFLGEVEGDNGDYDFVLLKKRPDKMRIHVRLYQRSMESGYDGRIGWRRLTNKGYDKVVPVEGKELETMRLEADFDGPLVGPSPDGVTRRLAGIERIDRVDYFIVEVETPAARSHHYVDSRTFRELKTIKWSKPDEGEPQQTISYFHDNQRHGQIWVSHRVERHLPGGKKETIRITDVEINPGILDRTFDVPSEKNPVPSN